MFCRALTPATKSSQDSVKPYGSIYTVMEGVGGFAVSETSSDFGTRATGINKVSSLN